jgi:ribose transport system substrate-binding protein
MSSQSNPHTKKLKFVVSLITSDNDFQQEQARVAEETSQRLNVDMQLLYAEGDAITQSQQLLKVIQLPPETRPDGIVFEAVSGTGLPHVARAAAAAGIGCVVLNCNVNYVAELRKSSSAPLCSITSDHEEVGRIQGRQLAALLPKGGSVLYIQGPSNSVPAQQRTIGMSETKPADIELKMIRGQWTEVSAHRAVSAWLRLATSRNAHIDAVACQNDAMAMGARKAFEELTSGAERTRWLSLPYIGCDGVPKTGQAWVDNGALAATVVIPANTGLAMNLLVQAIRGGSQPPERTLTELSSYPTLQILASRHAGKKGELVLK